MKIKRLMLLAIIIFALNLVWEFCHYGLYYDMTGIPSKIHIILAGLVDVGLVFLIILFVSLKNKKSNWIKNPQEKDYFFVILFALILAFVWEFINLKLKRWDYTINMPLFLGVGLSPLLQLAATAVLGLCIYTCIRNKC